MTEPEAKRRDNEIMRAATIFEVVTREMRKRGFIPAVGGAYSVDMNHDAIVMRFYRHGISACVPVTVSGLEQFLNGSKAMRSLLIQRCAVAAKDFDDFVARGLK